MTAVVKINKILVHAPLEATFEYVSNLTRHPEWSGGLRIEAVEPGPVAIGKEYVSHGEVAVQKARPNTVQVSEYEPPHIFGFIAKDPDFGDISHIFTFHEQNDDVLITRTMTVTLNPVMAFFFRLLVYPLIGGPAMDKSMTALKAKLEEKAKTSSW